MSATSLRIFHEGAWREYPSRVFAEYLYEWVGVPYESESTLRVNGVEQARSVQIVEPVRIEASYSFHRIAFDIPEGAESLSWRARIRSTSGRSEDGSGGGYHMSWAGLDTQRGRAPLHPDDEAWHEVGQLGLVLDPTATECVINFLDSVYTGTWYEFCDLQVVFDDAPWPEYWDGGMGVVPEWLPFVPRLV